MTCSHSNHQIHPWLCCLCFLLQSSKGTNLRSYPLLFAERHRILFRTSHLKKKKKTILKKELNQVSQQRESCFIRCVTLKKYEIRFFKKPLTKFIFLLRRSPQKISWKMWTVLCKKKKDISCLVYKEQNWKQPKSSTTGDSNKLWLTHSRILQSCFKCYLDERDICVKWCKVKETGWKAVSAGIIMNANKPGPCKESHAAQTHTRRNATGTASRRQAHRNFFPLLI